MKELKMQKKKISFIVNIYLDTNTSKENSFDHPTILDSFDTCNTFHKTVESINNVIIPEGYELDLIVLANAVNNVTDFDSIIKTKVSNIVNNMKMNCSIITNTDVKKLNSRGLTFPAVNGYCDLRNLGFIFAYYNNSDIIVQIDDDELVKENHFVKMLAIFKKYPHINILSGLYMNKNGIYQDEAKDYREWRKDKAMNDDRRLITASEDPVEIIYGMGGNMMIKREFFSQVCYPQDVPRGEDFALLLASNLLYLNGSETAKLKMNNPVFKTYATREEDLMIIHEQPYSEMQNRLKYIKLNLIRFIKQKFMLKGYIADEKYWELSRYMYLMTMNEDFMGQVKRIFSEAAERFPEDCPRDKVAKNYQDVKKAYDLYSQKDLFAEYKEYQKSYIQFLASSSINMQEYNELKMGGHLV